MINSECYPSCNMWFCHGHADDFALWSGLRRPREHWYR